MTKRNNGKGGELVNETGKILILISGKARHGKDTLALGAAEYGFSNYSFAKKLKETAREYLSPEDASKQWDDIKHRPDVRKLLQNVGATGRAYDRDIWIRRCEESIFSDGSDLVTISDCRFPNEIERMKRTMGECGYSVFAVRVDRPGFDNGLSEEAKRDVSETALDDYDFDLRLTNDAPTAETFSKAGFDRIKKEFAAARAVSFSLKGVSALGTKNIPAVGLTPR